MAARTPEISQFYNLPSFAAGEVAPDLWGRVDQELYYIGLRTARNVIIRQYGGVSNRPGRRFIAECRYPSLPARIIRFQFNELQTYIIEVGNFYMRFIQNGGQILEAARTITGISGGVITSAGHGYSNGDDVYIAGIAGTTQLNGRTMRIANATANTFTLTDYLGNPITMSGYTAYIGGGTAGRVYTITTPWAAADLFDLTYAQSNDTLTVFHRGYSPRDVTRTGNAAWTVSLFLNKNGPFTAINIDSSVTVTPSATTGAINLVASAPIFDATMAGELFYVEQTATDATPIWQADAGVRFNKVYRAGANFYASPAATIPANNLTSIGSNTAGIVLTFSNPHNLDPKDFLYLDGIAGTTEMNQKFYQVYAVISSTQVKIARAEDGLLLTSSNYPLSVYSGGGTMEKALLTGLVKPQHTEGTQNDGQPGVAWTYLHSGNGVAQITAVTDTQHAAANVIARLPDNLLTTPSSIWAHAAWSVSQGYPACGMYHKQRLWAGGTIQSPNGLWISGVNARTFFGHSNPTLDDESLSLYLDTTEANGIRHLLPLTEAIALTASTEQKINGTNGAILATDPPTISIQGYSGASRVQPIIINNTAIFVQDLGGEIRTLQYQFESDSFGGIDLTARSPHLFRGKQVVDWAFQRYPLAVVWTIMSDGSLNGLTFMEEQKVYAWHRHDTQGTHESVSCIREGSETAAYFVINRTVAGNTRRYIERSASRYFTDVRDAYFLDCGLTYDGRNTGATTITVTGGAAWDLPEVLTMAASAAIFQAADVGDMIVFRIGTVAYRIQITAVIDGQHVQGVPTKALPAALRGVATARWEFARSKFRPLDHLEGMTVNALADGNAVYGLVVYRGSVTLPDPAAVVHIGLPFVSDIETLDNAQPQGGGKARTQTYTHAYVTVQECRALNVTANGLPANDSLVDVNNQPFLLQKLRDPTMGYDAPLPAVTGLIEVPLSSRWSRSGRIAIRNVAPLPITVTCVTTEIASGEG